ncbi:hypothetical protein SmJEL517_g02140 [Synchytrium microbalum]|uniref:Translation machinery-associated protein 22 n=1 Tax=Synchytrium microbalum TaxID=1806994 RepID=A0A507C7F2_9FUNG|nr:uncharacterized protein SmJEL517_g02140 [Synchytrium microbalum]TPX35532.1 hypothetical protein SmJEL517_g02140 [Synchytrium microbalum]
MDEEAPETTAESLPTTRVLTDKDLLYCGVCTVPPEYCEYGATPAQCKQWLAQHHPNMFAKIYPGASLEEQVSSLSLNAGSSQPDGGESSDSKPEKSAAEVKAEKEKRKKASQQKLIIKRVERTKRKCVICITGLETFDLKKAAKAFATKFACGSSVTKNAEGKDEIVVQGDVQDDIYEYIMETWKVPDEKIELIEK